MRATYPAHVILLGFNPETRIYNIASGLVSIFCQYWKALT
jgi:hypothetical protein